ncbi:MAG TPA: hypothetical protein VIJ77_05350, partial [Candidatus Tumulicola sp.]
MVVGFFFVAEGLLGAFAGFEAAFFAGGLGAREAGGFFDFGAGLGTGFLGAGRFAATAFFAPALAGAAFLAAGRAALAAFGAGRALVALEGAGLAGLAAGFTALAAGF